MKTSKNYTIYFKPTNYCNVGCTHCYLSTMDRKHFKTMDMEQIKTVRNRFDDYFTNESITMLWHGGEPLTIPLEQFKEFLDEFNSSKIDYRHLLQTSLVPIFNKSDEDLKKYINFIKFYFDSYVGTSYDFGGVRRLNGSEAEYRKELKRMLTLFKENGVYSGVTVTITKKIIDSGVEDLFDFIEEFGDCVYNMTFERYNEYGVEEKRNSKNGLSITNMEYSKFMIKMYDEYKARRPKIKLELMEDIEKGITENIGTDKWSGTCLTSNLVVNPDGSINNCVDKADEESFGNIFENTIPEILASKKREKWIAIQEVGHKTGDCFGCEYQYICNSGCPLIKNEIKDEVTECSGYYRFIKHVDENLKNGKD